MLIPVQPWLENLTVDLFSFFFLCLSLFCLVTLYWKILDWFVFTEKVKMKSGFF